MSTFPYFSCHTLFLDKINERNGGKCLFLFSNLLIRYIAYCLLGDFFCFLHGVVGACFLRHTFIVRKQEDKSATLKMVMTMGLFH